jgi:hypothetical protein
MRNLFKSVTLWNALQRKVNAFENIFSNQWILIYPMQAIPALVFQALKKISNNMKRK